MTILWAVAIASNNLQSLREKRDRDFRDQALFLKPQARTVPINRNVEEQLPQDQLTLSKIFTPNDLPTITYVKRDELQFEERLLSIFNIPKMIVSISGPSKSGKTVLIDRVLKEELKIPVIGSGINSSEQLWDRALQWMEVSTASTTTKTSGSSVSGGAKGGGELGIPLVAKGKAEASISSGKTWGTSNSSTLEKSGLMRVIEEIADSEFFIFIDDFHYIKEEFREEVGHQIKIAADNGVKIVTASVPHRTDDVVRSNTELEGRVGGVDLDNWTNPHLALIARQGFTALNVDLDPIVEQKLSEEAMGSPQLMQTICFSLCQMLNISKPLSTHERVEVTDEHLEMALFHTSQFTDFSKMLSSLHSGPRARGQDRKEYDLIDGTRGDVYRSVLLAIRSAPISMSFTYDSIVGRVKDVCTTESPGGSSVTSSLEQMDTISENLQPGRPVLVWDGERLDITDPYFAFFLRCSDKISRLVD
jgi:hypothetical protein